MLNLQSTKSQWDGKRLHNTANPKKQKKNKKKTKQGSQKQRTNLGAEPKLSKQFIQTVTSIFRSWQLHLIKETRATQCCFVTRMWKMYNHRGGLSFPGFLAWMELLGYKNYYCHQNKAWNVMVFPLQIQSQTLTWCTVREQNNLRKNEQCTWRNSPVTYRHLFISQQFSISVIWTTTQLFLRIKSSIKLGENKCISVTIKTQSMSI